MVIFYGRYSLRTKTYDYKELELDESYSHLKFQLYQTFFFLFFIPVFPITRFWKVKDKLTDKEVSTDAELRTKLFKVETRTKTPYWTYIGFFVLITPVLFLIGMLVLNLTKEISRSAEKGIQSIEKRHENNKLNAETEDKIEDPTKKDVYYIKMIEMRPKTDVHGTKKGFTKSARRSLEYSVLDFSKDSIRLKLAQTGSYYSKRLILKEEVAVAKQDLIKISGNYKTLYLYNTIKINNGLVQAEAVFAIDEIERTP
ncbi:hypothetical protein [Aquimarina sp. AU474]|uniref:hypothetical protein n=1 Tax=Aquimarina sp. AU474 TaxID=2108529 RepID=UPI000D69D13C|nr:hypothetical protein [Aquimarina sp. AU474]